MRRQRPGHRVLSFHHRGLLLLLAAAAAALFLFYSCSSCSPGVVYSPRGRLVFIPLAHVSGSSTTSLSASQNFFRKGIDFTFVR